jgi:hypothetical protein
VSELAEVIKSRDPARIRQAFLLWLGRVPPHQLRALEVLMYYGRESWALDDNAYAEGDDGRPAETTPVRLPRPSTSPPPWSGPIGITST